MDQRKKDNINKAKAEEKAKRPPKSNAPRPSKGMSGQKHGTSKPRGPRP